MTIRRATLVILTALACSSAAAQPAELLIRCDDIGMCHTVNMAIQQVLDARIPVSASVMFACPWYQEGVEILKAHPEVAVGVHLTLNAEWKNYRWGPVSGRSAVPSLVDSCGFFFPSRALLFANKPKLDELERELRAQIVRAVGSGIRIDYVDYHMGTAVETAELRALVERLAREYGLGISRCFGETDVEGLYATAPDKKADTLMAMVEQLLPGPVRLLVFHIGLETPEMDALVDMNSFGLAGISRYRQGELRALISDRLRQAVAHRGVRLITYRDLIKRVGLQNMKWQ
jgi:chitin disaccharide deacetylase